MSTARRGPGITVPYHSSRTPTTTPSKRWGTSTARRRPGITVPYLSSRTPTTTPSKRWGDGCRRASTCPPIQSLLPLLMDQEQGRGRGRGRGRGSLACHLQAGDSEATRKRLRSDSEASDCCPYLGPHAPRPRLSHTRTTRPATCPFTLARPSTGSSLPPPRDPSLHRLPRRHLGRSSRPSCASLLSQGRPSTIWA